MTLRFLLNIIPLLIVVRIWECADWKSIGLRKLSAGDSFAVTAALLLFDALLPLNSSYVSMIESRGCRYTGASLLPVPEKWFLAMLAGDAIFEELATRAYVIERISGFTGSRYLGAIASFVLSVAMHYPGSGSGCKALEPAPMLALFTGLYLWRRSVPACALAHFRSIRRWLWVFHFSDPGSIVRSMLRHC